MATKTQARIKVRWIRSGIAFNRSQKEVIRSLGLRRLHQVVEREDSPVVRGLIDKVAHLVEVVGPSTQRPRAAVPEFTILPASATPKAAEPANAEHTGAGTAPQAVPVVEAPAESESAGTAEADAPAPKGRTGRKPASKSADHPEAAADQSSEKTGS